MNEPLLLLQNVTFSYNSHNHNVLERFSVRVDRGTISAVLGPNGAGKTTLLHTVLGWLRPQSGRVLLDGQSLDGYTRRELGRWMSLVPQSEHIPYEYSALEYVLFGRTPYLKPLQMPSEADLEAASSALREVGLQDLSERPVNRLSGGERQLVLAARALAQQPQILLLDEPTAHLDLANKNRLLNLLRKLNAQGVTIMLTTHEPEVAAAIATHVVLMDRGRVLRAGDVDQVFTSESLSAAYGVQVQVHHLLGRKVVLWM